jgi:K+-transporting ATPase A subunit
MLEPSILRRALPEALVKLDPRHMIRIPVMFVVEIGSIATLVEFIANPSLFVGLITLWLWATVVFAAVMGIIFAGHTMISMQAEAHGNPRLPAGVLLGEISPGGDGGGLYSILVLALLSVFVAGLMVGRTPEFLGKKIRAPQMKLVLAYVLTIPVVVLVLGSTSLVISAGTRSILNPGMHGLTEVTYATPRWPATTGPRSPAWPATPPGTT